MTPPWAFMDGIGLAHRRAVGCRYARPGVFPGDGRRQKASGASGTPPPTWVGCPLTGSHANLRRGVGTPPYGCKSRKRCRGGIYAARHLAPPSALIYSFFQNHIFRRGGFHIRPPLSHKWSFAIHGRAGHARPLQCGCLLSTLSFLPESAPARGLFLCPYPLYSAEKLWYTKQVIEQSTTCGAAARP